MKNLKEVVAALENIKTFDDLVNFSRNLYASGLLDESETTKSIHPHYGPVSPWSVPSGAEVYDDNGEDFSVALPSGEHARWSNMDRAWELAKRRSYENEGI